MTRKRGSRGAQIRPSSSEDTVWGGLIQEFFLLRRPERDLFCCGVLLQNDPTRLLSDGRRDPKVNKLFDDCTRDRSVLE